MASGTTVTLNRSLSYVEAETSAHPLSLCGGTRGATGGTREVRPARVENRGRGARSLSTDEHDAYTALFALAAGDNMMSSEGQRGRASDGRQAEVRHRRVWCVSRCGHARTDRGGQWGSALYYFCALHSKGARSCMLSRHLTSSLHVWGRFSCSVQIRMKNA